MGFPLEDTKLKRAGLDYWPYLDVTTYPDIPTSSPDAGPFYSSPPRAVRLYRRGLPGGAYLVFGREDDGLPEPLLRNPQACLRLPMLTGLRSLNLSNTVAVAAYEVLRQWGFPGLETEGQLHTMRWED